MKQFTRTGAAMLAALIAAPSSAAELADVRLGVHEGAMTRVVLDLRGGGAGFSYSLSDDGLTLIVALRAEGSGAKLPRRKAGLVESVTASPVTNGTRLAITSDAPISIVQNGVLEPEGSYHFYRIYFDLGPASAPPPAPVMASMPMPAAAPDPSAPVAATTTVSETMLDSPHGTPAEEREEREEGHERSEPVVTVKLGGVFERSVSDYTNAGGPTAALQAGMFHDALELELGTTALIHDGHTTWKTGLLFKKPIDLSEKVEFALGAGPIWLHRPHLEEDSEAAADSAGVEGVLEMVFWPGEHHALGFYAETGYSYDFGHGHDKAAGAGAGILIPLP